VQAIRPRCPLNGYGGIEAAEASLGSSLSLWASRSQFAAKRPARTAAEWLLSGAKQT
jgi:hypothetical protein